MHNAFVEFLIESNRLNPGDAPVLEYRLKHAWTPLGMIAMSHEMLTGDAVEEILVRQEQTKERFGEAAVQMSYLMPKQVEALLEIQRLRRNASVVEVLVLTNLLSVDDATDAFAEFLRREPHGYAIFDDSMAMER